MKLTPNLSLGPGKRFRLHLGLLLSTLTVYSASLGFERQSDSMEAALCGQEV